MATAYGGIWRTPGVARPVMGTLLGRIPDSIVATSLVLLFHAATGSYPFAGVTAAVYAIGCAAGAPVLGRLMSTKSPRTVLACASLAFAISLAVVAATAGHAGRFLLLGVVILAGISRPPLESALRAQWPTLVSAQRLEAAYAMDSTMQELIYIVGPLCLAALLAIGPRAPLFMCSAVTIGGTALYLTSARPFERATAPEDRVRHETLWTLTFAALLLAATLYGFGAGSLYVIVARFCQARSDSGATGVMIAVWGVGSLIGGVFYGNRHWRGSVNLRAAFLLAVFAVVLGCLGFATSLIELGIGMLLLGLPLAPWLGSLSSALEKASNEARRAEAFTWNFAAVNTGMAAGNAGAGLLVGGGTARAFLFAGAVGGGGAAICAYSATRSTHRAHPVSPSPPAGSRRRRRHGGRSFSIREKE